MRKEVSMSENVGGKTRLVSCHLLHATVKVVEPGTEF